MKGINELEECWREKVLVGEGLSMPGRSAGTGKDEDASTMAAPWTVTYATH